LDKTEKIWMDGRFVDWDEAKIHVLTHALHYATAVFEGIRCYNTVKGPAVFRLIDHVNRLFNSAKMHMMKMPFSTEEITKAIKDTVKINKIKECYIRPIVYYGYAEMGLNPRKNPVNVAIAAWPWGTYLGEEGLRKGVRCKISSWIRIDTRTLPPLAKSTANYLNSVFAKLEALDCGYDEAILLNMAGQIAEGPGENIFIVKDGCLVTPPRSSGALYGYTMDSVKELAADSSIPVIEREVIRDELFMADEAFFTGTAAELTPIREVDGRTIGSGSVGPITKRLQDRFFNVVRGKESRYEKWVDLV
jgi:branched-chain amino acid aminotransferase